MRTFHGNQYVYVRHPARKPIDWSMRIAMVSVAIYTSAIIVGATVKPPTLRAENPSIFSEVEFATPSALLVETKVSLAGVIPEEKLSPTKENIVAYITKVFGRYGTDVAVQAINCFYSESGLRTEAVNDKNSNGTVDRGVAQINSIHGLSKEDAHDFIKNIDMAEKVYLRAGKSFRPWYGRLCN